MTQLQVAEQHRLWQQEAAVKSMAATRERFGIDYTLGPLNEVALAAYRDQWHGDAWSPYFPWPECVREHGNPEDWCFALWLPERRLSALAAVRCHADALEVSYVEGDPREDCPLKPNRTAFVTDAIVRYGRLCGKSYLWAEPAKEELYKFFVERYRCERDPENPEIVRFGLNP